MIQHGVSIVTTTWNEKQNIKNLVTKIHQTLADYPHEIIIVDDNSPDGTLETAKQYADIAVGKKHEGQTKGLLYGMKLTKYPIIITIDADLENDPKHIPALIQQTKTFDIVSASRTKLPRISEKIAAKTLGKLLGVKDVFSNYRAFKKETTATFELSGGETFGAELLVIAKKNKFTISEFLYDPPTRRTNPRIGGTTKANLRILWALLKTTIIYITT